MRNILEYKQAPRSLKFFLVGILNTCFGYAIFALLTMVDIPYPVALGVATIIGICFNFFSTGRLVFSAAPLSRIWYFILVYGITYILNLASIAALLKININIYLATALVIPPLALITYFLQRKIVFK